MSINCQCKELTFYCLYCSIRCFSSTAALVAVNFKNDAWNFNITFSLFVVVVEIFFTESLRSKSEIIYLVSVEKGVIGFAWCSISIEIVVAIFL